MQKSEKMAGKPLQNPEFWLDFFPLAFGNPDFASFMVFPLCIEILNLTTEITLPVKLVILDMVVRVR